MKMEPELDSKLWTPAIQNLLNRFGPFFRHSCQIIQLCRNITGAEPESPTEGVLLRQPFGTLILPLILPNSCLIERYAQGDVSSIAVGARRPAEHCFS
jgi:hypothetical protein